jgi:hypothetical protein
MMGREGGDRTPRFLQTLHWLHVIPESATRRTNGAIQVLLIGLSSDTQLFFAAPNQVLLIALSLGTQPSFPSLFI